MANDKKDKELDLTTGDENTSVEKKTKVEKVTKVKFLQHATPYAKGDVAGLNEKDLKKFDALSQHRGEDVYEIVK